jgi:vancomycin resistance protein YoaR
VDGNEGEPASAGSGAGEPAQSPTPQGAAAPGDGATNAPQNDEPSTAPAQAAPAREAPAQPPPTPQPSAAEPQAERAAPLGPTTATPPRPLDDGKPHADGQPAAASRPGDDRAPKPPDDKRVSKIPGRDGASADRTIVLGGAAAAEGRTTGPTPRIAGAAPGGTRPAGAGAGEASPPADDEERGRHFRSSGVSRFLADVGPPWKLALIAAPVVVLVVLIGGWAVDTAALSGQVVRNVAVAGRPVGGLSEASLPEVMQDVADEVAARRVTVSSGQKSYETTAGELGLVLDAEATAQAALDAGRSDPLLTRPLTWLASFFSPRDVDVRYAVKESQVVAKMLELQGADLTAPHDPIIQLSEQGLFVAVPGAPGRGIDTAQVAGELQAAAEATPSGTIEVEADTVAVAPRFTDEEAQNLADQANEMTGEGLALTAGDSTKRVAPEQLRAWMGPTTANGKLELVPYPDAINGALPELFSDVSSEPVDASFDLQNGVPVVVPSRPGVACCGANSADVVWQALTTGQTEAELEVQVTEPALTTEKAEDLAITQPVGGNNAWRNGAPTTAGPGFTTYYDPGQPRVTNIHRIADMVRGAVILPGETFSVNGHVGQRTTAKGFVEAGAIREGKHVDEIGGGVSQFATTTFNAAYFAGLDITTYQAHTESFSRYPPGREATMGYPAPDLKIRNNTPYGVLIWTSYTSNSVTVTMYSTPYATAEQTGYTESMSGACRVVHTTRTRTFPDGHTENDTFKATYRPGEGQTC